MSELLERINDLLTEFDEFGFVPGIPVPDPEALAIAWRENITKAIEELSKQSEWISVDDRMPNREGTYLVYTWKGHILMCNCFDYFLNGKLRFDNYTVTHWMPLPEPPKGGAE